MINALRGLLGLRIQKKAWSVPYLPQDLTPDLSVPGP